MRVLICGGGAIGASIAYFLSCRGARAVVIERDRVACAASGKSGGFLALDWCDGTPLQSLARRSFALHASLPETLGGNWAYRRLNTYSGAGTGSVCGAPARDWLSDRVILGRRLGSIETTAQVDPARFTAAMMHAAENNGAELLSGCVTGVLRNGTEVKGVRIGEQELEGDAVVIALGPWSAVAARRLPLPPVFGLKGHSILFETETRIPPEALFLDYHAAGETAQPEIFPRADGTTYVCAISSTTPLPADPARVRPDPGVIERLERICADISPVLGQAKVLARQACYRPVSQDGLPLIGPIPGLNNVFAATGHSVWGILNAPATGEAMAELIADGAAVTVDLAPFDPSRLKPLGPRLLQLRS
jgi:glycine/D-amino acid oxidase-like deaminating enzyme